ncbi:MAG TPA: hypothetical protein VGI15_01130, partial [Candidatus Cybelea sp.]
RLCFERRRAAADDRDAIAGNLPSYEQRHLSASPYFKATVLDSGSSTALKIWCRAERALVKKRLWRRDRSGSSLPPDW